MHESSLARQLLSAVLQGAEGAKHVRGVHGWLAETEALNRDAIEFHFRALAKGTIAADASLDIKLIHTEAKCRECEATYKPEHHLTLCPECGCTDGDLLGPTGLGIDTIDVD